jgi:hypothetical protein
VRIDRLYRYPVKGLTAEALADTEVEAGGCLPWDRAFALAQGDAPFDPDNPQWLQKRNFMCLMANARIALLKSSFDPRSGRLAIQAPSGGSVAGNALLAKDRERIGAWLVAFLGDEARGTPRLYYVPGHSFCDDRHKGVSLINLASIADLERRVGAPRDPLRFRANIYFSQAPAGVELDWIGRELQVGGAHLRVTKRIVRCAATEVNPLTATRDANPVAELRAAYGHADLGILADVIEGGRMALGDALWLLPD